MANNKALLLTFVVALLVVQSTAFFKFHEPFFNPWRSVRTRGESPTYFGRSLFNRPKRFGWGDNYQTGFGRDRPLSTYYGQRYHAPVHKLSPSYVAQQKRAPMQRYLDQVKRDLFLNHQNPRVMPGFRPKVEPDTVVPQASDQPQQETTTVLNMKSSRVPTPSRTSPPTVTEANLKPKLQSPHSEKAVDNKNPERSTSIVDHDVGNVLAVDDEEAEWPSESKGRWASEGYVNTRGEFIRY
mmetsp:Transcript_10112/g.12627  ORF Transcript_10112/g.12627 Transcript_10112/m.12627 type:complete len:240 (+) Transcript_10112:250-969(+)|eukprot:CAMPEP_0204847416 /NCGR_PEP_ID=MMETSP1347-20130617/2722_1 /ASSEMBLY_ACC=CAM_ASM_000690 /TAXON_ID=215587 /ORGANISM="Aplanochytrium stocchinoi, Strain GSBS06" /LENGTH=239 /DNA_ID=CAMNT_0051988369 /DNA_START=176 /DNA_END=895 /DNA_ORIENTATION=-